MVRNFTTALIAALVLGSVGIASARVFAPSIEHYDGWTYPQPYCYLPSWPASNPHRITNASEQAVRLVGRRNRTTMPSKNPLFKSVRVKPRSLSARTWHSASPSSSGSLG